MANDNCLTGLRCPNCHQEDRFFIVGTTQFEVFDDGTEGHGDIEWDEDALATCATCEYQGKLEDFRALTEDEEEHYVCDVVQCCYDDNKVLRSVVEEYVLSRGLEEFLDHFGGENPTEKQE